MAFADPTYPAFPIFAFLSFVLVLIPLPWHLQAWNSGTCLYMIWTAIGCLNQFINSIIWHGNTIDWAPVWCDISTRLTVGIAVAIPAASLCINRRLFNIATCQTVSITAAHKRRALCIDLLIGLGLPALQMILQFIVQGHRYDIFEDVGCTPTTVNTPPAYPLSFLWPNVLNMISAIYCILTLRAFMLRRAQFNQFVSCNSSLTTNRYFRLMSLATLELIFNVPISTYGLYLNITGRPIYPWKNWSDIHFDWYTIDTYAGSLWRSSPSAAASLELGRWSLVLCALVFFAFFGFAEEARKNYRRLFGCISRYTRWRSPQTPLGSKVQPTPISSLPVFHLKASPPPSRKPSASFSDAGDQKSDCSTTLAPSSPNDTCKVDFVSLYSSNTSRFSRFTI